MNELSIEYKKEDRMLFIDQIKISLKRVLLRNKNTYASMPVAHPVHTKETRLGFKKKIVKTLPKDDKCSNIYLSEKFLYLSEVKGVFVWSDIRKQMLDSNFKVRMTIKEKKGGLDST